MPRSPLPPAKTALAAIALAVPILASLATSATASTREITLGVGHSHFNRPGSDDGPVFTLEYDHTPFHEHGRLAARFGAVLDVQSAGDFFAGAGVSGRWTYENAWFIDARVMPGAYFEHAPHNDLGATFEVRSQIAVGRELGHGRAISVALAHKSNASTGRFNPGVNSLLIRWHTAY